MIGNVRRGFRKILSDCSDSVLYNFSYIIFGIFFLAGFVLGCIYSSFSFDITPLRNGNFTDIFVSYLSSVLIYQILLLIEGSSVAGVLLIPPTVFFRGLGIGSAAISLYTGINSGISWWSVIILVPHFILFAIYIIFAASVYFKLSLAILKLVRYGNNFSETKDMIKQTTKNTAVLLFFMFASALIYCFCVLFLQTIL